MSTMITNFPVLFLHYCSDVFTLFQTYLQCRVDLGLCFVEQGGTSFQAVALMEHLITEYNVPMPQLIDMILSNTIMQGT